MKTGKTLILLIIPAIIMTACESGPRVQMAPGFDQTPTPIKAQANMMGTPVPTRVPPTPTIEPLTLDNQVYTIPSLTLSFYPPQRWDLLTESDGYVKFSRPDGAAWFEGAVESSGYTLSDEAYTKYVNNLLGSLYGSTKEYQLLDREVLLDRIIVTSSFMKGDQQWYAMDFFLQRDRAVYALSFQAHELAWNSYKDKFSQIIDRVRTQTGYLKDDLVYVFRKPYQAPGGAFELYMPLGWELVRDEEAFPDGVVETISSPDGEANIDIIVLDATQRLIDADIGQISIGILKERISKDLRVLADDVLLDGRIRVDWQVDKTGEGGYTFFWLNGNDLIILTYRHTSDHKGLYQDLLFNIGDSLNFPELVTE